MTSNQHPDDNNDGRQRRLRRRQANPSEHSLSSASLDVGSMTSVGGGGGLLPAEEEEKFLIANKETRAVMLWKLVVLIVLTACAGLAARLVYRYATTTEHDQFAAQFQSDANKVLEAMAKSITTTLTTFDALAITFLSHARSTGQEWPFVTMDAFALRAANVLELSNAIILSVEPLIRSEEQRIEWENYTNVEENLQWIHDTWEIQETWDSFLPVSKQHGSATWQDFHDAIVHNDFGHLPYNRTNYLPTWQSFPLVATEYTHIGWDWLGTSDTSAVSAMLQRRRAVITEPYLLPQPDNPIRHAENQAWADCYSSYLPEDENPFEPAIDIMYPIVDDLHHMEFVDKPNTSEIVGMITASMYWRDNIRNILPVGSQAVIVFENPCNVMFTYLVDGPKETYLGTGDHHNPDFDYLGIHSPLLELDSFAVSEQKYKGAPIDDQFCPYTLHVYPSDAMYEQQTTNVGAMFALAAIGIFAMTSIVFIFYDCLVERRQRIVMGSAVRSNAIVSSLFPSNVRDRIQHEETGLAVLEQQNMLPDAARAMEEPKPEQSPSFMGSIDKSPPIADLYPNTTVMFADIVGFTAWSSKRSPTEVFVLLETLYGAFDKDAKRYGVFKVETIGDCYVAVAGLPSPRKDHATVMARFAAKCVEQISILSTELEATLGPGTSDLKLRVGLNSGPCTAGVLRGEKSRFQLFGDTVNVSARMEANSEPMRIMVSEFTAALLRKAGKDSWLAERPDKVQAKGKGSMTCYWCNPKVECNKYNGSKCLDAEFDESESEVCV